MALVINDMVRETSTTTGTGTYDLAGAVTGFQGFVVGIGTTNTTWYSASDGTDWEVGIGTVTDATPDTLARTTILQSSNADAAVSWPAGTKTLRCTLPASKTYVGPATAVDERLIRFDGTTGEVVQDSGAALTDAGFLTVGGTAPGFQFNRASADIVGGSLNYLKNRDASDPFAFTAVVDDDSIVEIGALGADGDQFIAAASIQFKVGGVVANNAMPGKIFVYTNSGGTAVTERWRWNKYGAVGLAGNNCGTALQFLQTVASGSTPVWASAGGLSAMKVYTTTGNTWTKPAGLSFIIVEAVGGGGGGGGSTNHTTAGSGGGAGGYARRLIAAASLGTSEAVTVGTGGSGGASGGAGVVGTPSSFGGTSFLTAGGGNPGLTGGGIAGVAGGVGGLSTSGDINNQGGNGGYGASTGITVSAAAAGFSIEAGDGGASFFGGGGMGGKKSATGAAFAGTAGTSFGSGGGGGAGVTGASASGGAGKSGIVIVWEFV